MKTLLIVLSFAAIAVFSNVQAQDTTPEERAKAKFKEFETVEDTLRSQKNDLLRINTELRAEIATLEAEIKSAKLRLKSNKIAIKEVNRRLNALDRDKSHFKKSEKERKQAEKEKAKAEREAEKNK